MTRKSDILSTNVFQKGLGRHAKIYCSLHKAMRRSAMLWLALSFGLASCSSDNKGQEQGCDAPDAEKEIVVIDYPDYPEPKIPRRFNPEHEMQHFSVPESVRKRTMDAYLRTMSRLSADGKDWTKFNETGPSILRALEKEGYYGEMRKRGYMPASGHPYDYWLIFATKYFPCMCLDIYQTLRNNPSYLDGIGLKGFSRMLTYDLQYYTDCLISHCKFPRHLLREIGIYSIEAPPLREGEQLSAEAKSHYKKELHRVYYTEQDKSSLFPQDHGN